jgi:hypothetical protein
MNWLSRVVEKMSGAHTTTGPHRPTARGYDLDYARQPERGWQEQLDAATAVDDTNIARLWLHWVPGDPWQPVHRWFVFQLQPWHQIKNEGYKQELRGPHPRTNAQLVYRQRVIDGKIELRPSITGGPCRFIDRNQWVLHRELQRRFGWNVMPRYFWVIQGDAGGHPYQITDSEQALRQAQGLPADVPCAGDLPYAPFDRRVLTALQRYDLWRYAHGQGDPVTSIAKVQIARQAADEREANRLLWASKENVMGELADGFSFAARKDGLHYHRWRPVGAKARAFDYERMKEHYINDTTLEAAS